MSRATQSVRGRRARACSSSRWPRSSMRRRGTSSTLRPAPSAQRSARPGPGGRARARGRTPAGRSSAAPFAAAPARPAAPAASRSATKSETAITRSPRRSASWPAVAPTGASCTVVTRRAPVRVPPGRRSPPARWRGRGSGRCRAAGSPAPADRRCATARDGFLRRQGHRQMRGARRGELALERAASRGDEGPPAAARRWRAMSRVACRRLARLRVRQQLQHGRRAAPGRAPPVPPALSKPPGTPALASLLPDDQPWHHATHSAAVGRDSRQPSQTHAMMQTGAETSQPEGSSDRWPSPRPPAAARPCCS